MLDDTVTQAIYEHAERDFPKECCGIVTAAGIVIPLENQAGNQYQSFCLSAREYLKYSSDALFTYHSHPNGKAVASEADHNWVEQHRLPLMIVSWPYGDIRMIGDPCKGREYEGRTFIYGVFDCYSLVQDFYLREYDVMLPIITRPRFGWWESGEVDAFTEGADNSGLVDGDSPEEGDILLFSSRGSRIVDHIAIYLGDETILHHKALSLSARDVYDSAYRKATTRILRRAN